MKLSKMQMLTTKFESIRIQEDLTSTFHSKLSDIINSYFNLGEKIPESKDVKKKKTVGSLLERLGPKVTTIEESKDINTMRVYELVRSLQTFSS